MITIIEHEGIRVMSSLDIYKKVGYNPTHYSRWAKMFLPENAKKGVDYFDITKQEDQQKFYPIAWNKKFKTPNVFFLTINTAICVCLLAKTEKSKKLKLFLELQK